MRTAAIRVLLATSRHGSLTPTFAATGGDAPYSLPPRSGRELEATRRWRPTRSSTTKRASKRTKPPATRRSSGKSFFARRCEQLRPALLALGHPIESRVSVQRLERGVDAQICGCDIRCRRCQQRLEQIQRAVVFARLNENSGNLEMHVRTQSHIERCLAHFERSIGLLDRFLAPAGQGERASAELVELSSVREVAKLRLERRDRGVAKRARVHRVAQ